MMKVFTVTLLALLSWAVGVYSAQLGIGNITECGLQCLFITVPESGCSVTNTTCQCSSQVLPQLTTACMLKNCTMHDSLILAKVQASICDLPHPSRSHLVAAVCIAILSTTIVFMLMRLYSKKRISNTLGLDDWLITSGLVLSFASTFFTVRMTKEGFGKHLWDLEEGALLKVLRDFYVGENIYLIILSMTKLSILVFYLRIFPQTWFRIAAYAMIVMIVISTTTISLLTVFQCHPVQYFWNKDIKTATCVNLAALAYANASMSIIQDVLIVALPVPVVSKLRMGKKKKLGVAFMFAVGSFGCIISMIRLKTIISFGNSIDPTWDYTYAVIWTALELAVAIICACFPAVRRLLKPFFPNIFDSSGGHSDPPSFRRPSYSWRLKQSKDDNFVELQHSDTPSSQNQPDGVPPKEQLGLGLNVSEVGSKGDQRDRRDGERV